MEASRVCSPWRGQISVGPGRSSQGAIAIRPRDGDTLAGYGHRISTCHGLLNAEHTPRICGQPCLLSMNPIAAWHRRPDLGLCFGDDTGHSALTDCTASARHQSSRGAQHTRFRCSGSCPGGASSEQLCDTVPATGNAPLLSITNFSGWR